MNNPLHNPIQPSAKRPWRLIMAVLVVLLTQLAGCWGPQVGPPVAGDLAGAALNASVANTAGNERGGTQPTPTPVPGSGMSAADDQVALDAHNQPRQAVGVPNLIWSPEIATVAKNWAEQIVSGGKLVHSSDEYRATNNPLAPGQVMGENIASAGPSTTPRPDTFIAMFVYEQNYYHYDLDDGWGSYNRAPGCDAGQMCNHYTQIVWRTTQYVGCGFASDRKMSAFVCNYYPPGNYGGVKPY